MSTHTLAVIHQKLLTDPGVIQLAFQPTNKAFAQIAFLRIRNFTVTGNGGALPSAIVMKYFGAHGLSTGHIAVTSGTTASYDYWDNGVLLFPLNRGLDATERTIALSGSQPIAVNNMRFTLEALPVAGNLLVPFTDYTTIAFELVFGVPDTAAPSRVV